MICGLGTADAGLGIGIAWVAGIPLAEDKEDLRRRRRRRRRKRMRRRRRRRRRMKLNSLRYIAFMKLCANHRNSRDEGLGYHRGND